MKKSKMKIQKLCVCRLVAKFLIRGLQRLSGPISKLSGLPASSKEGDYVGRRQTAPAEAALVPMMKF
jgi:hypothetical protein